VQIELIRQDDRAATIYRDWNSDALHHVQIATDDYEGALALCEENGFPMVMHGRGLLGSPDLRFAYCDLGSGGPAGYVEFAYRPPGASGARDRTTLMQEAARNWRGEDPLRPLF
jgi:hypothetical protein